MNQKLKRIKDAIMKEGMYTFRYLMKEQLREHRSEEEKYRLWRRIHEETVHPAPLGTLPGLTLFVYNMEQTADARIPDQGCDVHICGQTPLRELALQAEGECLVFLQKDCRVVGDDIQRLAVHLADSFYADRQFIYVDCDVIDESGRRSRPFFRPDYSPDTLRSFFYMEGLLVMKKELAGRLVRSAGLSVPGREYMIALEASLVLKPSEFGHISEVLCHRQKTWESLPPGAGYDADRKKLLEACGIKVQTESVPDMPYERVVYCPGNEPLVSIIIPSKDNPQMCEVCLESIERYTVYRNYEIIVVDNGSSEENRSRYRRLCESRRIHCEYVYEPMDFNFSEMCNLGAERAQGDYYLFLNDDIEICHTSGGMDWLTRMLGQAAQPHTGAVGAKLLYPGTNLIQHDGVVNYESGATHLFSRMPDEKPMSFGRNRMDYNYSAVTAACMLVAGDKFRAVGGFEKRLAVAFNDVELCFRLLKAGWFQVVRNDVVLYHHESVTRGDDALSEEKFRRNLKERELLFALHPDMVKRDTFYSRNLTQKGVDASINVDVSEPLVHVSGYSGSVCADDKYDMRCHIYCVQQEENVCIRGYAYAEEWKNNDKTRVKLILENEVKQYEVSAHKVYNGTLAKALDSGRRLSFAEFQAVFPERELEPGQYQITVVLSSASGRAALACRTEQNLTVKRMGRRT